MNGVGLSAGALDQSWRCCDGANGRQDIARGRTQHRVVQQSPTSVVFHQVIDGPRHSGRNISDPALAEIYFGSRSDGAAPDRDHAYGAKP